MDYIIPFRGLKEGKHEYEFNVDNTFFEFFPDSEIKEAKVQVNVDIIKRSIGLEATFYLSGKVKVTCDKCLDEYLEDIDYTTKLFFEFGHETVEISDELILLSETETQVNLADYIYEFINLSLPFRRIHPDDFEGNSLCNAEMLAKLEQLKGNNNDEIDDPRWDKLKDLIN